VCDGNTGHAEVVQIEYDPAVIDFRTLLEVFFVTHDPTTLNRQGADVGTQYRSVVFYHDAEQERVARDVIAELTATGAFPRPIVTEVAPLTNYFPAEDYHQNYYASHPEVGYCQMVIAPKLSKFREKFATLRHV
jgi:peptide-methionine (S)-S-oxide reductase